MNSTKINKFIECLVPITACNLNCHYCYVTQRGKNTYKRSGLQYSANTIAKALTQERLGGPAYLSICGAGETLLVKEIPEVTNYLLKNGHYINITTNGTISNKIDEILTLIPSKKHPHIHFAFSFHYLELKRKNLMDVFFSNIKKVKNAGCSFLVQINLCDEYEPHIKAIKEIVKKKTGAFPQVAVTRKENHLDKDIQLFTRHSSSEYNRIGKSFNSELFNFTMNNFMKKRREYCYAGNWSYVLNLSNGVMRACYESKRFQNIFVDVKSKIQLTTVGRHCPSLYCMNSSHFLSLGVIPNLKGPTYAELRNRTFNGGSWYNKTMRMVLMQKLSDTNHQYSFLQKLANEKNYCKDFMKFYWWKLKRSINVNNVRKYLKNRNFFSRFETSQLVKFDRYVNESSLNIKKYSCQKADNKVIIFMTSDYGNLGDIAISIAQKKILQKIYPDHKIIEIPFSESLKEIKTIKSICNDEDIITIIGGGNMGNKYYAFEEIRSIIIRNFLKNKIISFPQTIDFSKGKMGKKALNLSKKIYNRHPNLLIFAREQKSYNLMKHHFIGAKVFIAPDVVMTLPLKYCSNYRKGVIISMRDDKEKCLQGYDFDNIVKFARAKFKSVIYYDSHIGRDNLRPEECEAELNLILSEYGKSRLVLTDRLHGMVFAYITGTPAIVFPNSNHKVEECYKWIKDFKTIKFIKNITVDNLNLLFSEISNSKIEDYEHDRKREAFEKLIIDAIVSV